MLKVVWTIHVKRREERCTDAKDKKMMEEEKKVRVDTIFVPVPEEIRRPTYLE